VQHAKPANLDLRSECLICKEVYADILNADQQTKLCVIKHCRHMFHHACLKSYVESCAFACVELMDATLVQWGGDGAVDIWAQPQCPICRRAYQVAFRFLLYPIRKPPVDHMVTRSMSRKKKEEASVC